MTGCVKEVRTIKIVVEENQSKLIILNPGKEKYLLANVDGCMVKHKTAADNVLSKEKYGDLVIELKGTDVDHAVDQIMATADYWRVNSLCNGKMAAVIVCKKFPRVDTKVQRAKSKFSSKYKGALHILTKTFEIEYQKLFDQKLKK